MGFLPALIVSLIMRDRRPHTQLADASEHVEPLSAENGVAYTRHHHVQQNQGGAYAIRHTGATATVRPKHRHGVRNEHDRTRAPRVSDRGPPATGPHDPFPLLP